MKRILLFLVWSITVWNVAFYLGKYSATNEKPEKGTIANVLEDVNKDGAITCIDKTIIFYDMARTYGLQPHIIYGSNYSNTESHLWIRMNDVDIEPFAYKSAYWRPDPYVYNMLDLTFYSKDMCNSDFDWNHLSSLPRAIKLEN